MVQELNRKAGRVLVGLTGTFGSGKSTVARLLEPLGAEVVDADRIAREALAEGSAIYPAVALLFPEAVEDRGLCRKKIAQIIFTDAERRRKLEAKIHPYVFQRMAEEAADSAAPIVVLEVPLLYETGFDKNCDVCLVVKASSGTIEKRLSERGFSPEDVRLRQSAQMPLEEKVKRANFVIDNEGDLEVTRKQVEKIWKTFNNASKGDVSHHA